MILGIDPGTQTLGWALVKNQRVLYSGSFSQRNPNVTLRSIAIVNALTNMLKDRNIKPEHVVIEDQYVRKNVRGTIVLTRLVGMLQYTLFTQFKTMPYIMPPTMIYAVLPFNAHKMDKKSYYKAVVEYVYKTYNVELSTVDEAFAILLALTFELKKDELLSTQE